MKAINQIIDDYIRHGKPELNKHLKQLAKSETPDVLSGRTKKAVETFLNREKQILPRITAEMSIDDLNDLVYDTFMDIPGIGEQTLTDYMLMMAYRFDIPVEANCISLLTRTVKRNLLLSGLINGKKVRLGKIENLFKGFSTEELADFLNKNHHIVIKNWN